MEQTSSILLYNIINSLKTKWSNGASWCRITVFIREQQRRQVSRQEVQAEAQALQLSYQENWLQVCLLGATGPDWRMKTM